MLRKLILLSTSIVQLHRHCEDGVHFLAMLVFERKNERTTSAFASPLLFPSELFDARGRERYVLKLRISRDTRLFLSDHFLCSDWKKKE
jgi:hypothetical protein